MKGKKIPYEENHRVMNNILEKKCNQHHIYFPNENPWFPCTKEYFYTTKNKKEGLRPDCKRCNSIKSLDWQRENPEKRKEHLKRGNAKPKRKLAMKIADKSARDRGLRRSWRQRNLEKCRYYASLHRNHDITPSEERALLEVFKHQCAYCSMTEEESKKKFGCKLHNDHVDEDGSNDLRNDVPACMRCNCSKHDNELEDWYFNQEFFNEDKYNKIVWWITEGYKDYIEDKPPYKITRKQNEDKRTFHWELWSMDELRNPIGIITTGNKKKDILNYIKENQLKV